MLMNLLAIQKIYCMNSAKYAGSQFNFVLNFISLILLEEFRYQKTSDSLKKNVSYTRHQIVLLH